MCGAIPREISHDVSDGFGGKPGRPWGTSARPFRPSTRKRPPGRTARPRCTLKGLKSSFRPFGSPAEVKAVAQESSVVAVYDHLDQAEEAVQALGKGGFPVDKTSIIARNLQTEKKVHGFVTSCDVA